MFTLFSLRFDCLSFLSPFFSVCGPPLELQFALNTLAAIRCAVFLGYSSRYEPVAASFASSRPPTFSEKEIKRSLKVAPALVTKNALIPIGIKIKRVGDRFLKLALAPPGMASRL